MKGNLIKLPQLSAQLGVDVQTLRAWRARGYGPHMFKLGRSIVAYESDVDRWLRDQYEAGEDRAAS